MAELSCEALSRVDDQGCPDLICTRARHRRAPSTRVAWQRSGNNRIKSQPRALIDQNVDLTDIKRNRDTLIRVYDRFVGSNPTVTARETPDYQGFFSF
ncbi:hypothetical protein GCM10009776_14230 [Microbacterium deminutum]|uniref:Uncharacterized protein n=1 Tax=Microbacterium deminutum TaxID=344164 RepID=A0ABP5BW83_9MICO